MGRYFYILGAAPLFATFLPGSWRAVGVDTNLYLAALCGSDQLKLASCLLRCANRKLCGQGFMLMKLICSVSSNQSHGEYPDCRSERESGGEASLLVSPLVVAGIVIGLVLFLSCVTIIIGSLRKDSRLRNPHHRASYGPDGFSYGGSVGELRSTCLEDFPPGLDFDSYTETLSQTNNMYSDSPPGYDECVGPGATQIYIPTDDPPPYSLLDPCQRGAGQEEVLNYINPDLSSYRGETSASAAWFSPSHYPIGLQEQQQIASISFPLEAAPPYESVVGEQGQPLPLMPCDLYKHQSATGDDGNSRQPGASQIL
ncbi:protein BEAN1 isoform X2 [Myripristis murdjan]|uniref:protein BEAN1 isoform X2 n=1 Tax=Myripristis murdjan TaxID=586833 RepID=UPI0011760652|nr:protein BEAN1 isoform X2 [Myripristis murdjan]